ncbi:MAG: gliding motility-associated C-terminal domain-containing protein [Saprospiraceae bacterium]
MVKRLVLLAILFTTIQPVQAQREYIHRFENLHANTRYYGFFKMTAAPDGGWALAGCDSATRIIHVLRFDSCGDLAWSKAIEAVLSPQPSRCFDLFFDAAGDLVVGAGAIGSTDGFFFVFKFAPNGNLRWSRSWKAARFGLGMYTLGALPNGQYFFAGANSPPSGPRDYVGVMDSSGNIITVRTYFVTWLGYGTHATVLRSGHLLIRHGPHLYEIDPLSGTVFWKRSHVAPLYSYSHPIELEDGFLAIGQFSDSQNLYSGLSIFLSKDGKISKLGEVFRANGGIFSNTTNLQIQRVCALPDGNFATVTTDSLPQGFVSVVVFSPAGTLVRQTLINPAVSTSAMLNHDFCLLSDGTLAIAANAGGRLAVIKTSPLTNRLCDALPHKNPVPYQTHMSEVLMNISVDTYAFEPLLLPFSVSDFAPGQVVWCDDNTALPDRDTVLEVCPGDTVWANAFRPDAARYSWEDGSDSMAVRLFPGQPRVATVTVGCETYQHRFEAKVKEGCPCPLIVPNAFTPDSDGINDVFLPECLCGFAAFRLSVFNRWGQMVFSSDQSGTGWDGSYNGEQSPSDVYAFVLEFQPDTPEAVWQRQKGMVTLLR